jgi:hypothetical protein
MQVYFFLFVVLPMMRGKGEKAPQKPWDGAEGLEWEVPSPAPWHTFETPPKLNASGHQGGRLIRPADQAWRQVTSGEHRKAVDRHGRRGRTGGEPSGAAWAAILAVGGASLRSGLHRQDLVVRAQVSRREHLPHLRRQPPRMFAKLLVVVAVMFGFGYALVPMYRAICEALGINVLSLAEQKAQARSERGNSQVDRSRKITVEFDANVRGPGTSSPRCARCKCTRARWRR